MQRFWSSLFTLTLLWSVNEVGGLIARSPDDHRGLQVRQVAGGASEASSAAGASQATTSSSAATTSSSAAATTTTQEMTTSTTSSTTAMTGTSTSTSTSTSETSGTATATGNTTGGTSPTSSLEAVATAFISQFTAGTSVGNVTIPTTMMVAAPTIVPELSLLTSGASTLTVTAGAWTLNAVFSGTPSAAGAKPSTSIPPSAPLTNNTVPATSNNVTYSSGNWAQYERADNGSDSSSGGGGATPLAPNLNNQNVPVNLQCPSEVTPQQTRSSDDLGATVVYSFIGTAIFAQVVPRNNSGIYTAWVDDDEPQTYDGYQMFAQQQQSLPGSSPSCQLGFSATGLANRTHTMHIKIVAPAAAAAQNQGGGGTGLTLAGFTTTTVGTATEGGSSGALALKGNVMFTSIGLALVVGLIMTFF